MRLKILILAVALFGEVQSGELAVILLCGLIVSACCLLWRVVASKVDVFPIAADLRQPSPTHHTNTLKSARIVLRESAISLVFRVRRLAQVGAAIVERVSIYVVSHLSSLCIKDQPVHGYGFSADVPFGIKLAISGVSSGHPIQLRQPCKVDGIHDANLAARESNETYRRIGRLGKCRPWLNISRHAAVAILLGIITTPSAFSQSPSGGYGPGTGGGTSSPSSLTTFFNGYTGLSPQDCSTASCNTPGVGAKGNWHTFYDCTISAGTAIENCTNPHFTSTAVDGGKAVELECNVGILVTTISTVQSGTQATLAATCAATQTNTAFAFGTDDTVALRNWAAFISAAFSSTATTASVRAGYLPRGQYYTTKAVRWIFSGPAPPTLPTTSGECTKISAGTIWCPLYIVGDGTWASTIIGSSNFNWAADGTSANTGLCYVNAWSGSFLSNMGCGWAMGQESGFSLNTTGQSGIVGTWVFDNNSHTKWDSNFAYAGHNTTNNMGGLVIDNDFESEYSNSAVEFSDINLYINPSGIGKLYEKIVFDTLFCEGGGAASNGNIQINGGSSLKQVTFRNVHSRDGNVSVNVRVGVATSNGDALVFERFRQTSASVSGSNLGFVVQSAIKVECDDCYLEDTSGTAASVLITTSATAATFHLKGGGLFGTTLTNCMTLGAASIVYAMDTNITGCTNNFTGTGVFNALTPSSTGWSGPGGLGGTYFVSNQGTALVIGNVAVSAGWGTTAAVTSPSGFNQHFRFTITASGTGQAANPTVTVTLPNALPAATTSCTLQQTGGTGAFTMMLQTSLSATAPIFTLQGTPTAAATYIYDGVCGP